MQLYTLPKPVRLHVGALVGLSGKSLTRRLPDLVEPHTTDSPLLDEIEAQGVTDGGLSIDQVFMLVTLKFDLDFKAGEILLLDPKQAKGLGLQPLEAQPEPPTEPPTQPPAVPPALSSEGVKSEAPAVVDPLTEEDTAPTPLGDDAFDPLSDKEPTTVGELLAQSQLSEAEGEGVNDDGD